MKHGLKLRIMMAHELLIIPKSKVRLRIVDKGGCRNEVGAPDDLQHENEEVELHSGGGH